MWRRTDVWRPGRAGTASGGYGVQCGDTHDLGYAKPRDVHQERVASVIAGLAGVAVPEIRLGQVEGCNGWHAVSIAFGSESIDLKRIRETVGISPALQQALGRESGILALHAWFATGDLKEEHILVASDKQGEHSVAAIDFASAFAWGGNPGIAVAPTTEPRGLIENVDKAQVLATVERMEALTDDEIRAALAGIPEEVLPAAERERIATGLIHRRGSIRQAMQDRGWWP
jgi:hypothetical protein